MCEMALLMLEKSLEKYDPIEGAAKIAKLNDEQMRKLNRAIELWELEQKGRLLVLPCKMGDTLYMIVTKRPKINMPEFSFIKTTYLTEHNFFRVIRDYGKTVFLTRKEAEAALKGEGNG